MNRASYTVDFKLSVVEWVKNGGKSLREASKQFGVDRKCIRQWVKERAVLGSARLRQGPQKRKLHGGRCPRSQELDGLVLGYMLEQRRLGLQVGDHDLKQKAVHISQLLRLEDFKASPSWLKGWKYRNGLSDQTSLEQNTDVLNRSPVGSALVSHVTKLDSVLLPSSSHQSPRKPPNCHDNKASHQSNGNPGDDVIPDTPQSPKTHLTSTATRTVSHVITPDHTYSQSRNTGQLPAVHFTSAHINPDSSLPALTQCISTDRNSEPAVTCSYVELLGVPLGGHLLETTERLSNAVPSYCSVQSMCIPSSDPVMSSTQVDHFCELDISLPLENEEVVISRETRTKSEYILPALPVASSNSLSSSLASLSPPKRTSVESRSLLWPTLGCSRTSPVTFPEFHDFTDPLTGLLGNRRSQPVFPAGPEILMSTSETS